MQTRRQFLSAMAAALGAAACGDATTSPASDPSRIHIRPAPPTRAPQLGLQPLGMTPSLPDVQRDGVLYVPRSYRPTEPLPLVVLLHGASGSGSSWFGSYSQRAEDARVVMLAPDSRGYTWDAIEDGSFGRDIAFIENAIVSTFDRCAIDATRLALVGFSDGASYALSVGLANGDSFPHVAACSPGGILDAPRRGNPAFFIAHGREDTVLPIASTSRVIVPELRKEGYAVTYTEFEGEHELPAAISDSLMDWLGAAFR